MYYLNAFNEMLRKRRQQNNMMNGGGQDYPSQSSPSGPMGARQTGNFMTNVRDLLNNPYVGFAASATPFRAPFAAAKLGVSAYDRLQANQNPYADDSMDRLSFNAPSPEYGPYADDSMDRLSFNTPVSSPVAPQSSLSSQDLSPMAPVAFSSPIARSSITGESLAPLGGTFDPNAAFAAAEARNNPNFSRDAAFVEASRAAYNAAPAAVVGNPIAPSSLTGESLPNMAGNFGNSYGGSDNMGNTGNFGGVTGGADTMGFGGTYAHGGMVDARHLKGRAPAPDDGYGALQGGEYVITKAAVEKYGKRLLDAINNGTFR